MTGRYAGKRTESQWQGLIDEQQQSGLTVKAYCERHQVTLSSFYFWKNKLSASPVKTKPSPPSEAKGNWLSLEPPESTRKTGWDIELDLPGGVTLRVRAS